jgi:cytochrome c oxidase subunit 2
MTLFPLLPPNASTIATEMDLLYLFIVVVCAFFTVVVTALILFFAIKYKRRHEHEVGADIHGSLILELTWTFIPFVLAMVMFVWGADLFFRLARPPADAMTIHVVGKQWMWKVQHPEGVREINEMHVPINRNVKIQLGSEDVLHDYFIPAFRVKMDAVPGKWTSLWFNATKPGTYHIFCAEYCGTNHSGMIGQVIAMEEQDYQAWLASSRSTGSIVETGEKLFADLSCSTCHRAESDSRGPSLIGLSGSTVALSNGATAVADDNYLRESIMNPSARTVRGFQPIMPPYQGMVSEEHLMQLIAYIKTLRPATSTATAPVEGGQ